MTPRSDIQKFVDQVVRQFQPGKVILFGSHASGKPTRDSDVDLMVILPRKQTGAKMATKIRLACPRKFSMDLLVRSEQEFNKALRDGDPLVREVSSKGIVLHEAAHPTMGR